MGRDGGGREPLPQGGRRPVKLRHLAAVLHQDADFLGIDEHEARRLKTLAEGTDPGAWPGDDVPEDSRPDYVLELARLLRAVATRFDEVRAGSMT